METIKLKSWDDFRRFVDQDRQISPVYWRGQAESWPLASKYEREILSWHGGHMPGASKLYPYDGRYKRDGKPIWDMDFYRPMRDRYLHEFQKALNGVQGGNSDELSTDEWWALGRHHGLITPLLDWTEKPYIAAFFALSECWRRMNRTGSTDFNFKEVEIYRLFDNGQLGVFPIIFHIDQ